MNPFGQQIQMNSRRPQGYQPAQTRAAYNNARSQAVAAADPRAQMKTLDKAGLSRGKGQQAQAAAGAAAAYAQGMNAAEAIPLQDASANANLGLSFASAQDQQALALSRALEAQRHTEAMNRLQRQSNSTGYLGGLLSGLLG